MWITCHPLPWSLSWSAAHLDLEARLDLMVSSEHPRKILDSEMDVITRWDTGLPFLRRSMCVLLHGSLSNFV